ncbi:hypothetical protein FALBO_418 [Fusarium albosuccineum]|uniref:DUF1308 domain-containing protein n=1 Tax=Fusarium albosuccineum TaxID=1237068 RepID=A0A8H4LNJ0_9HYPO|nr:hypothetical protein FALBO_418 [Fusarium albosuccineum]
MPDVDNYQSQQNVDTEVALRQSQMLESAGSHSSLLVTCIHEIERLMQSLEAKSRPVASSGLPTFVRTLQRENETLKGLIDELSSSSTDLDPQQLTTQDLKLDASINVANRCNAQWDRLKRCRGFVAVNQAFQGSSRDGRRRELAKLDIAGQEKQKMHRLLKEQGRIEVDVVDGGAEWLAVKAVSRDRLARQMTDCGWGWGDHELGDKVDEDEWEDTPLAKYVRRLVAAARMNRHEYQFPRIRLVLSNLSRGEEELDIFLYQLEHMDPLVQVIIEDQNSSFITASLPPLDVAIDNLVGDELASLTPTINLDHTILIDLISDLTHMKLEPQPWQSRTTRVQIEEENSYEDGLMARTMYPVLAGRRLLCTREAAIHFHEVLETVGTDTERERGRLLVPWDDEARSMSPGAVRKRFQELSAHDLPPSVQVPVTVIDESWDMDSIGEAVSKGTLPRVAEDVARTSGFKSSKLSIFMYGWAAGLTTVTSNKEVRGQVRTWVEAHRKDDEEVGPQIWRVDVTRNLLAKAAKPREGWQEKDGIDADEYNDD